MDHLDGPDTETTVPDLIARRPDVLRRLLERGVPAQTIQLLFPDWDGVLAVALGEPATVTG